MNRDLALLKRMVFCRQFELLVEKLALAGEVRGMAHLGIGQEAVAAGIAPLLTKSDWANGTYRNVTLALCLDVPAQSILAELLGKPGGLCGGMGGHMHLFDLPRRFLGTDPVVGAAMALGAGAAFSLKQQNEKGIAVTFLGEGALGAGISHEVFNLAKLWNLPVLFVVENNGYAISTPLKESFTGTVLDRARSYGIAGASVDGNDACKVREVAEKLMQLVRSERGPALLEACTYRHRGHSKSDTRNYRSKEEEHTWLQRDPIELLAQKLEKEGALPTGGVKAMVANADAELNEALKAARKLDDPSRDCKGAVDAGPHEIRSLTVAARIAPNDARRTSYRQAINEALGEELQRDPRVVFLGQDVGVFGGAYKASVGLQEKFGRQRVIDTPIAELGVCQLLVGAAMTGTRPVFEVMFGDFLALCSDAIINHAAKFRFASGGKVTVPLVVRAPFGPGNGFGATHSQSVERWFAHVPGLTVAVPSTPYDVKTMLQAAIRGDEPVLILEPIGLYANTGPVPEPGAEEELPPLHGARIVANGSRVTCVSYGRALFCALAARERLPEPELVEVIDLRCILPLDRPTILESVARTGALLVIEDDHKTFGIGGEILASAVEAGLPLRHGIRLAGADVPTPYSAEAEAAAFPSVAQAEEVLKRMLA